VGETRFVLPICVGITMFQSDDCPISSVYDFMENLYVHKYTAIRALNTISAAEYDIIRDLIDYRWKFIYNSCHGMAYMLDPRYLGVNMRNNGLANNHIQQTQAAIYAHHADMPAQVMLYRAYIMDLLVEEDPLLLQIRANEAPVKRFIQSLPDHHGFPLVTSFLLKLFSCVCSSAASERNFSTHAHIHTKVRNRLKDDKVKMSVYLFTNMRILYNLGVLQHEYDDFDEGPQPIIMLSDYEDSDDSGGDD